MRHQLIALALALVAPLVAQASDAWVYVGLVTTHPFTDTGYERNEDNQLVMVGYKGWMAGTLNNSYEQRTWLMGHTWQTSHEGFYLGAGAALTYGYCWEAMEYGKQFYPDECDPALIPAPVLTAGYSHGQVALHAFAAGSAINAGVKIRF